MLTAQFVSGELLDYTPNIDLSPDGSASFASNVTKLTAAGSLFLETTSAAEGIYGGNWLRRLELRLGRHNGNATFAGNITINSIEANPGTLSVDRVYDDSTAFYVKAQRICCCFL